VAPVLPSTKFRPLTRISRVVDGGVGAGGAGGPGAGVGGAAHADTAAMPSATSEFHERAATSASHLKRLVPQAVPTLFARVVMELREEENVWAADVQTESEHCVSAAFKKIAAWARSAVSASTSAWHLSQILLREQNSWI